MFEQILKLTIFFFIIVDAVGNVPLFVGLLHRFPIKRQREIIFREMLIALSVMLIFFFFGNSILDLLGVSDFSLQVTGGTILFLIATDMIFSMPKCELQLSTSELKDPMIVPLAIPSIAGPAILAALTILSADPDYSSFVILVSLLITWLLSLFILLLSPIIKKLGNITLSAIEQLFGFFVALLSFDMIISGLQKAFFH